MILHIYIAFSNLTNIFFKSAIFIIACYGFTGIFANAYALDMNDMLLKSLLDRDYDRMQECIKNGADINSITIINGLSVLDYASYKNDLKLVTFLIKAGAAPQGNSKYPAGPIFFAILNDNSDLIDVFIKNGISPNFAWEGQGGTLLTQAVQMGKVNAVKTLIRHGADVNYIGNGKHSPLFRAIIHNRPEIRNILLDNNAELNGYDKHVLHDLELDNLLIK